MIELEGTVEAGFEAVAAAFQRNFTDHDEIGAACCAYAGGRRVVDLWGGIADPDTGRPWEADTPVLVFSTTKGATATCVHLLVERGVLDLDAPVASVWPEFAAEGKDDVTLRWLLSHRAGVPAIDAPVTMEDIVGWDGVVAALAAQRPAWEPGTTHGYHARTFGWGLGEVIRRVCGRSCGQVFADEITGPLGLDWWIGLPESLEPVVAPITGPAPPADPEARKLLEQFMGPDTLLGKVLSGPSHLFAYDDRWNTRPLREAEMPSSNGIATARGVAGLYAALLDGFLRPATLAVAVEPHSEGNDAVLMIPSRVGLGYALPPMLGERCGPSAFGHPGAGGSLGFADPDAGVAFGYVMNRMKLGLSGDERSAGLVDALYGCL